MRGWEEGAQPRTDLETGADPTQFGVAPAFS